MDNIDSDSWSVIKIFGAKIPRNTKNYCGQTFKLRVLGLYSCLIALKRSL